MNIAVIPARGGSKRIVGKNTRDFCGKPMIAWSIEAARQSELFDRIVVSTDCKEVAAVARDSGAVVPFLRPAELADDHTPTIPVIRHAIQWYNDHDVAPDAVCCIYATAPFLQADDLRNGFQLLRADAKLDFTFPVTSFEFPIFRALKLEGDRVEMLWPEHELARSQDLTPAYHDAGQFYWGKTKSFFTYDGFFCARSAAVVLPSFRVQDIDTPDDWARAELMFQKLSESTLS